MSPDQTSEILKLLLSLATLLATIIGNRKIKARRHRKRTARANGSVVLRKA